MEERLAYCIKTQCQVEVSVEFPGMVHDYFHSYIQEITEDGFVVFDVHYVDPREDAAIVSEIVVPLEYIVRVARIKRITK